MPCERSRFILLRYKSNLIGRISFLGPLSTTRLHLPIQYLYTRRASEVVLCDIKQCMARVGLWLKRHILENQWGGGGGGIKVSLKMARLKVGPSPHQKNCSGQGALPDIQQFTISQSPSFLHFSQSLTKGQRMGHFCIYLPCPWFYNFSVKRSDDECL